jgi:hypothetical protein
VGIVYSVSERVYERAQMSFVGMFYFFARCSFSKVIHLAKTGHNEETIFFVSTKAARKAGNKPLDLAIKHGVLGPLAPL